MEEIGHIIGVDGGGTKTAICMAALDSSKIFSTVTGSASWREYGIESVVSSIKNSISSFPVGNDARIKGIAMGLPCFGESETGDRELRSAICKAFDGIPVYLTNDVEMGWAGSLGLESGINVVAGTGAIAFGKDENGNAARCGGWSEFFSDEGSCYWLGRKVMELFSKQSDGRMPKDALYDVVRDELRLQNSFSFIDLMHNEYIMNRAKVASLQLLAKKAVLEGSVSAMSLYNEAATELGLLVTAIRDQLDFTQHPFSVSYSGGLFKSEDLVLAKFTELVEAAGGKLAAPQLEPAQGALLMAFSKFFPLGVSGLKKSLMPADTL